MLCQTGFDPWRTTSMPPLSPLSKPQATVLALWSFGIGLARACALSAVSRLLAEGMPRHEQTVRPRRRAWYYAAPRQRGTQRQALRGETCFPLWWGWGGRWWHGTPLPLAIEATTWGQRLVGLASSGVSRGWAIPVAWGMLPAGATHAWRCEWRRRLRWRRPAIPSGWTGIVLANRGLSAP